VRGSRSNNDNDDEIQAAPNQQSLETRLAMLVMRCGRGVAAAAAALAAPAGSHHGKS
jgi:hypothetical protein